MDETGQENVSLVCPDSHENATVDTSQHDETTSSGAPAEAEPGPSDAVNTETLICILHTNNPVSTNDRIKSLNALKWDKILKIAEIRRNRKNYQSSKYKIVIDKLPCRQHYTHGYHVKCYSDFTSIPVSSSLSVDSEYDSKTVERTLRSVLPPKQSNYASGTDLFPNTCIFCNNVRFRKGNTDERPCKVRTNIRAVSILEDAKIQNDGPLLAKISGVDLIAKECQYHRTCIANYHMVSQRAQVEKSCPKDSFVENDDLAKYKRTGVAWQNLCNYIEQSVILDKRSEYLTSLFDRYEGLCRDIAESCVATSQTLKFKLQRHFNGRLNFLVHKSQKMGTVVYSEGFESDALKNAFDYSSSPEGILEKAAQILREEIKKMKKNEFPVNVGLLDIGDYCTDVPDSVQRFFTTLYGGINCSNIPESIKRKAKATAEDATFNVSNGLIKPLKHIALGIAVKSMTGSKQLVTILNRLGYSINYSCVQELETGDASYLQSSDTFCPIKAVQKEVMGMAFDNYDELTGTLSGCDSLHDTNGIMYQNCPPPGKEVQNRRKISDAFLRTSSRRKRTLEVLNNEIEPYCKKSKLTAFAYTQNKPWDLPDPSESSKTADYKWMMSHALLNENIPMWVGYNAKNVSDDLPKQTVMYMPSINKPCTRLDVIQETMRITQECANEIQQDYGIVTYDLAAAKPAMQIQDEVSPKFDNIFIMLGQFHIEMVLFKAIGKIFSESGGFEMLTESGVLAEGSLNGFVSGKYFNRCKRIHPLLALSLEKLHFQEFLAQYVKIQSFKETMSVFLKDPNVEDGCNEFKEVVVAYEEFQKETRSGKHGPTAQFWLTYIDYMKHFHYFERSVRTNDIPLFIWCLTKIISTCFATNHFNYARWLTKYQLDLMNIDETKPGLRNLLENGAFSVRRSDNSFSRMPVDLTVEQTVNRDSASRTSGISRMTNSHEARLKYMMTQSSRASMISTICEIVGLDESTSGKAELSQSRINRDNKDICAIEKQIVLTSNPFTTNNNEKLYNLTSGRCCSEEVEKSLLGIGDNGERLHRQFVSVCLENSSYFEKPIKKVKLLTFENECAKNKHSTNPKVASLKSTNSLMGRLLSLTQNEQNVPLDIEYVLTYPLTPVPLTLSNSDGTIAKTQKSVLLHDLSAKVQSRDPTNVAVRIIDGNFLLHTMSATPRTYGQLAKKFLLQALSQQAETIHIVFDAYNVPSIKEYERQNRQNNARTYTIEGTNQLSPLNFKQALKSTSFKRSLPSFFQKEWSGNEYCEILGRRTVYVNHIDECVKYQVQNSIMKSEVVPELCSNHDEGDTKICLHAVFSCQHQPCNLVIRASDTDIAIVMISNAKKCGNSNIWMQTGTASKNDMKYINLSLIANSIGPLMSSALPAFHAFTGSDYTSAFIRKGKKKPLKMLENSTEYQKAFSNASQNIISMEVFEKFVCEMYGCKSTNVNNARFEKFKKICGPQSKKAKPLEKMKTLDPTHLPPCKNELDMHIRRAGFVAKVWTNADSQQLPQVSEDDGWVLTPENKYEIVWFQGDQLPASLIPTLPEDINQQDDEEVTYDSSDAESIE